MRRPRNSWYGEMHTISTPRGNVTIRSRTASRDELQALADAFRGDYRLAAKQVGMDRRKAHDLSTRMGLIDRKRSQRHTEYTHPVTGKTIRVLAPWGTINRVCRMYVDGMTTREIGEALNVPDYTVWSWLSGLGLARKAHVQNKITVARKLGFDSRVALEKEIRRLRSEGARVEDIARVLGVSRHMVSRIQRSKPKPRRYNREYVTGRGNPEKREQRRARVQVLRADGVKPIEIAAMVGVSVATIYNDLAA